MERMLLLMRLLFHRFAGDFDRRSSHVFRRFSTIAALTGMVLVSGTFTPVSGQASQPQTVSGTTADPLRPSASTMQNGSGAQTGQAKPTDASKSDPVPAMIAEAEKAYQDGLTDYKAGHLDAAKQDFNHAVDILMSGPVSVPSDDRLQAEFDKITEQITQLEMSAFKGGDGFTEQQAEPAPIDEANQVTFPPDPKMTAKAQADLKNTQSDLPLMLNEYVAGYISYFSSRGRGVFERALVRSGRYREMIQRIFKEQGVPQDLIYLAQAESGFKPLALSRARARGMWQFMASRGVGYGLRRTWWVDDRQDPERSTEAAAKHLKDLYNQFGDWYLAMAAYNSGPGNVQQAVQRTGYADFWELYRRDVLPKETKNYVPIIMAMIIMSKNPQQYGLDGLQADPPEKYDVVKVNYPVDLRLVAECVDATLEDLVDLNPSLLRRTTPKDQSFELHLPEGSLDKYLAAIETIPKDKRVAWRYHHVQPGDTLAAIARKYHATERSIAQANGLQDNTVVMDARLVIPVSAATSDKIRYSRYASHYKVHTGDTVLTVAEDFGVPPESLRRWNKLKGNDLRRGRLLVVYKPLGPGEVDKAPVRHSKKKKPATTAARKKAVATTRKETLNARTP